MAGISIWFVEEMTPLSRWQPSIYCGLKPSARGSCGKVRRFRNEPAEVPPELTGLPVSTVAKFMAQDGEFSTVPNEEIETVIEELRRA